MGHSGVWESLVKHHLAEIVQKEGAHKAKIVCS